MTSGGCATNWLLYPLSPAGKAFVLFTAQPEQMRGVVAHVGGGGIFASQVCYPVTELVVTRRDKAALFTVKGLTDWILCLSSITVRG